MSAAGIIVLACSSKERQYDDDPGASGASGGGAGGSATAGGSGAGDGGDAATAGSGGAGSSGEGGTAAGGQAGADTGGSGGQGGAEPGFRGGPCVASADGTVVEVFARGDDQQIYRRVIDGEALGSWSALADLDGSVIDNRSDLDCAGNADASTIHIVAVGREPPGTFVHAFGFDTTYNDFAPALDPYLFTPNASVTTFRDGPYYVLAGLTTSSIYAADSADSPRAPDNAENLPWSGLDSALLAGSSVSYYQLAVFDSTAQLALYTRVQTQGGPTWSDPLELPPPPDEQYQHSPTICTWAETPAPPTSLAVHLAVTAGGRLWHAYNLGGTAPFSEWESIDGQVEVASAPDCATTSDGSVHIVALDTDGGVVKASGSSGAFTLQQLGGR